MGMLLWQVFLLPIWTSLIGLVLYLGMDLYHAGLYIHLLPLFSQVLDHLLTTALRQGLELPLDLLLLLVLYPLMMILLLLRDLSLPPPLDLEPYEGKGGV